MINKNDLRYIKTDRLIQETYLKMRAESSRPVQVGALCTAAQINKSTFYTHYEDIIALHRAVCLKLTKDIIQSCDHVMDVFADTHAFVTSLLESMDQHWKEFTALFEEGSIDFSNLFEEELLTLYIRDDDPETAIKMKFAIGGALRLLIHPQYRADIDKVASLIRKVL